MQNQEKKKSLPKEVVPALAKFANDVNFSYEVNELPTEMLEITELLMETEQADQQHVRLKALNCLRFIRDYSKAMESFDRDTITLATHKYCHA